MRLFMPEPVKVQQNTLHFFNKNMIIMAAVYCQNFNKGGLSDIRHQLAKKSILPEWPLKSGSDTFLFLIQRRVARKT